MLDPLTKLRWLQRAMRGASEDNAVAVQLLVHRDAPLQDLCEQLGVAGYRRDARNLTSGIQVLFDGEPGQVPPPPFGCSSTAPWLRLVNPPPPMPPALIGYAVRLHFIFQLACTNVAQKLCLTKKPNITREGQFQSQATHLATTLLSVTELYQVRHNISYTRPILVRRRFIAFTFVQKVFKVSEPSPVFLAQLHLHPSHTRVLVNQLLL